MSSIGKESPNVPVFTLYYMKCLVCEGPQNNEICMVNTRLGD